jgi:D-alanine-D-alanine ligase
MKTNIAVIAGGYTSEYPVSIKSQEYIIRNLDPDRYNIYPILITPNSWTATIDNNPNIQVDKNNFTIPARPRPIPIHCAWITIHGTPGEDGLLQGYLDMLHIPYINSPVLPSALTYNKYHCKKYLSTIGIHTPPAILVQRGHPINTRQIQSQLGLPLFVKPNTGGSSLGATKVTTTDQILAAIELAFHESAHAIIESGITGTEVTCGCYRTGIMHNLPVTEVVTTNQFFNYDAKYSGHNIQEITPARITPKLTAAIQDLTVRIYDTIGARGIIRVDYIITPEGDIQMLEVNTTPGMTATSFIPQQIHAAGLKPTDVFTDIITHSF